MGYRDPKKERNRLRGERDEARCKLIDAERSGDFARTVSARRRLREATEAYETFVGERVSRC